MHRITFLGAAAAATLVLSAHAGFVGWMGRATIQSADTVTFDVFAGMSAPTDRLLNVFNANISIGAGTILQGTTAATNKWRPTLGVATMNDIDSFVTLGGYQDGGAWYAGDGTTADPGFTNYATAGATTIPANAGWYASDPTSSQINAVDMSQFLGSSDGVPGSTVAPYGVWVAHFAIKRPAGSGTLWFSMNFSASAAFNTGQNLSASNAFFYDGPAPGAAPLLALAGLARGARRRR